VAGDINRLLEAKRASLPEQLARDLAEAIKRLPPPPPPLPPAWVAAGATATPSIGANGVVTIALVVAGSRTVTIDVRPGETIGGLTYDEWVNAARDGRTVEIG